MESRGTDLIIASDIDIEKNKSAERELHYLKEFSKAELEKLCKKHNVSINELEDCIKNNRISFTFRRGYLMCVLGTNLLYLLFQIETSNAGVQKSVEAFFPGTKVPNNIAYSIGIPAAILDSLLYIFTFSAEKIAKERTLDAIFGPSIEEQMSKAIRFAYENSKTAAINTAISTIDTSILLTAYMTSTMTEIIEIYKYIPENLKLTYLTVVFILGWDYHQLYQTADYHAGKQFMTDKNRPWLISELLRGNIATPLQIFIQGHISTVLLRAYPYYWYLALASKETLGWWLPAPVVASAILIQSSLMSYPYSYDLYLGDRVESNKILKRLYENSEEFKQLVNQQLRLMQLEQLDDQQYLKLEDKLLIQFVDHQRKTIEIKVTENLDITWFTKPEHLIPLLYRGLIGGYFGYNCLTPVLRSVLDEYYSTLIFGTVAGCGLFAGLLYKAELNRVVDKLVRQELVKQHEIKETDDYPKSCRNSTVKVVAAGLNVGNGASQFMATMGTEARMLGDQRSFYMVGVAVTAFESMINTILFNWHKVGDTLLGIFGSTRVTKTPSTFFNNSPNQQSSERANDAKEANLPASPQIN